MVKGSKQKVPSIRFPAFSRDWREDPVDSFVERYIEAVDVESGAKYREIGVRSHGKGIFHKVPVLGKTLGSKRVFWVHPKSFVVNIVFGWEQAVALTSEQESGFIASHRFPMYIPRNRKIDLNYLLLFFLRKRGKHLLGLASPGGAGRNKTLGQKEFGKLKIVVPELEEQQKIAAFLGSVDDKLNKLRSKRELLETWKRGLMQKIFSQDLRFAKNDGSDFPDWEEKKLGDVFGWERTNNFSREMLSSEGKIQNIHYGDIHTKYSVQFDQANADAPFIKDARAINDLKDEEYCRVGDVVIADASEDYEDIGKAIEIVDVKPESLVAGLHTYIARPRGRFVRGFSGYLFQTYAVRKQIKRIAQGISVLGVSKSNLDKIILLQPDHEEQKKIADFLSYVDKKIEAVANKITQIETFKKGLLQKMFV